MITRVGSQNLAKILVRLLQVPAPFGNVAETLEGNEIFGVELENDFENFGRFVHVPVGMERLAKHHVAGHVFRLLFEVDPADRHGALQIPRLAVLVRQAGKVPSGIVFEFLLELEQAGGFGHKRRYPVFATGVN
jgi:hypothetical protein